MGVLAIGRSSGALRALPHLEGDREPRSCERCSQRPPDRHAGRPVPSLLKSFTCPRDLEGTLAFGLYTEEVADLRWPTSAPDEHGVPDCVPAELPARFCLFLLDGVGDMGEVVALDVDGNEIGRASFS
jgi:hypothetical protein